MKKIVIVSAALFFGCFTWITANAHGNRWADSHSGNDTAVNENRHANAWDTNGCTAVADSQNGVFHFEHACDHHDGCYGQTWGWRISCDNDMHQNMEASCKHNWQWWNPARTACRAVRDVYYAGVRTFGWPFYARNSIWTSW